MGKEKLKTGIRGLIFDMDGLLVDTEGLHVMAWKELFLLRGFRMKESSYAGYAGVADTDFVERLKAEAVIPSCLCTEEIVRDKTSRLVRLADEQGIGVMPGALEILEEAKDRFLLAVASNSEKKFVLAVLRKTGLERFFRHVTTRNDISRPKPAADIYIETARKMGLAPSRCLVFEDSDVGIESAGNAGMACIAISACPGQKMAGSADLLLDRLHPDILKEIA